MSALTIVLAACGHAPPVCAESVACGASADGSCLGGTCTTIGELPPPAATRVVRKPVAVAWVRHDASARGAAARLGGKSGGKLLLRFSAPVGDPERLLAAHLVLSRLPVDPPLSEGEGVGPELRALRIVDAWDADSVTWATQPRTFDIGLPRVRVRSVTGTRLRIDVRALVTRWSKRDPTDQGIAIEAEGAPPLVVALGPVSSDVVPDGRAAAAGPELELYFAGGRGEPQ